MTDPAGPAPERPDASTVAAIRDDWPDLLSMLAEVYEPRGVGIWLFARQDRFDGLNVIEMAAAGRMDEVLAVAEQMVTGGVQ